MLTELASHNLDIQRLLEKGFALSLDSGYLVVRDIPYLDALGKLHWGAIVTKLVFVDQKHVKQNDHQVFFAGSAPHELDGKPVPLLGGGRTKLPLSGSDVIVERSFSNKPKGGFPDFFVKIAHYTALVAGPAIERYKVTPYTFGREKVDNSDSVFKYQDTLTSRAEIGDLSSLFNEEIVAVVGLGGTGGYLLDFLTKMQVKEIRGFDHDDYHVHNAYRSPGQLNDDDLGKKKAEVYQRRYDNFRRGLSLQDRFLDAESVNELDGVTFAFVCVDKGSSRSGIFDLLIQKGIPFIDMGLGLDRKRGPLAGQLRATYYPPDKAREIREKNLAEMADDPNDEYRQNVQIAELNALNACLGIIRYKQIKGFYVDDNASYHLLFDLTKLKSFTE